MPFAFGLYGNAVAVSVPSVFAPNTVAFVTYTGALSEYSSFSTVLVDWRAYCTAAVTASVIWLRVAKLMANRYLVPISVNLATYRSLFAPVGWNGPISSVHKITPFFVAFTVHSWAYRAILPIWHALHVNGMLEMLALSGLLWAFKHFRIASVWAWF